MTGRTYNACEDIKKGVRELVGYRDAPTSKKYRAIKVRVIYLPVDVGNVSPHVDHLVHPGEAELAREALLRDLADVMTRLT